MTKKIVVIVAIQKKRVKVVSSFSIAKSKNIWVVWIFGFWSWTDVTKPTFIKIFSKTNFILFYHVLS